MNWTGGQRQRHSNTTSSLKLRQQQHFAKVRANLMSGKKRSPPKHPNIDRLRALHEGNIQSSETRDHSPQDHDSPSFERFNYAPRDQQASSSGKVQQRPGDTPPKHAKSSTRRCKRELDESLYNYTPQPRVKPEREPSPPLQSVEIDSMQESISEKRRKILQKGDWVSVGFQRAPQLEFPDPKQEKQVGRRRKLTGNHRPQYTKNVSHPYVSPLPRKHQPPPFEDVDEPMQERRKAGVKISIGGKMIPPGISSSSARSKKHSVSSRGAQLSRRTSRSSDIMLLDNLESVPGRPGISVEDYRRGYANHSLVGEPFSYLPELPSGPNIIWPASQGFEETPRARFASSSESLTLHHPRPQSNKVAPILETASTPIAESTMANVGRLKASHLSSDFEGKDVWANWMGMMMPGDTIDPGGPIDGDSADDHNRMISPGISAVPTYGLANDHSIDSIIGPQTENLSSRESPRFETSDMYEEVDGMADIGELYSDAGPENIDHISSIAEDLDLSTQSEEYISDNSRDSSSIEQRTFKILSPIPELGPDEALEEPLKDNQYCLSSISSNDRCQTVISPPAGLQEDFHAHRFPENEHTEPQKSLDLPSNILCDGPSKAISIGEGTGDDAFWRKYVFGSDNPEFDIFHNEAFGIQNTGLTERSMTPNGCTNNSMSPRNSMRAIHSGRSSTLSQKSFTSEFMNNTSRDGSWVEADSAATRPQVDYRSTAGNATSAGPTSSYTSSSVATSTLASDMD